MFKWYRNSQTIITYLCLTHLVLLVQWFGQQYSANSKLKLLFEGTVDVVVVVFGRQVEDEEARWCPLHQTATATPGVPCYLQTRLSWDRVTRCPSYVQMFSTATERVVVLVCAFFIFLDLCQHIRFLFEWRNVGQAETHSALCVTVERGSP